MSTHALFLALSMRCLAHQRCMEAMEVPWQQTTSTPHPTNKHQRADRWLAHATRMVPR